MDNLFLIFNIIEYIIYIYLLACSLHLFFFSLSSFLYKEKLDKKNNYFRSYAILIPGYKEDRVIVDAVNENLKLEYPKELFDIYVLADSFSQDTLTELSKSDVKILEMKFENSTKAKSLNSAVQRISKKYDNILILDADNIAEKKFLKIIDNYFDKGYKAVQGHRKAKNKNTKVAGLDGLSEEINNTIFRKGHFALGFSSALIGSAMAFEWNTFCNIFPNVSSVGEDKEFDILLMQKKVKIAYSNSAIVYDEKISNIDAMENQRSRWIAAQYDMFTKYFISGFGGLFKGNIDLFVKTLHQILLPRILMLGVFFILICFYAISFYVPILNEYLFLSIHSYLYAFSFLLIALLFAIPRELVTKDLFISLFLVPKMVLTFAKSFIKSKKSKDKFIHTEHGV